MSSKFKLYRKLAIITARHHKFFFIETTFFMLVWASRPNNADGPCNSSSIMQKCSNLFRRWKGNHFYSSSSDLKFQNFDPLNSKPGNQKSQLNIHFLWWLFHPSLPQFLRNTLAENIHVLKQSKTIIFRTFLI